MQVFVKPIIGLLLLGLVGCGMEGKKSRKRSGETLNLYGEWEQSCQTYDFLGLTHFADQVKFNPPEAFEQKTRVFGKDGCRKHLGEFIISGTFAVKDDSAVGGGTKDLDLTVEAASFRPQEDELVKVLNTAKYCGFENWQKDKLKNILNRDCANAKYKDGMVVYDIYKRDGDTLYLGESNTLITGKPAAKRPTVLDEKNAYEKND